MTEKEILAKVEELNARGSYREIMELIENLPEAEQTPPVLCELARAFNNAAVLGDDDTDEIDTGLLKAAVAVLERIEDEFPENDHLLNYRMGYALFYLDRIGDALERFKKALIGRPNDEDTEQFIGWCIDKLTLPVYDRNFAQRIEDGWEKFAAGEEKLRRLITEKAGSEEITDYCHELLSDTFIDFCYELGFNGEKYDLILSPEKDKLMLYLFDAFKKKAPESILKNWNILLGRQPARSPEEFELGFQGNNFSVSDVTVKIEQEGGSNSCNIIGYCEKLAGMMNDDKNNMALWALDLLLDMTLGEIVNMRYVDTIDLAPKPFDGDAIPLIKLPEEMKKRFGEKEDWDSVESYLDTVSGYEMKPKEFAEDEYPLPRLDSFVCFSSVPGLIFDYYNNETTTINKADNDGAAAGFIFFPVQVFEEDENAKRGEKILNFRDELQNYIEEKAGESCVFVGGASGVDNCYLDFLAWDIREVLDAAVEFFAEQNIVPWAFYQSYRTDVRVLALMPDDDEQQ